MNGGLFITLYDEKTLKLYIDKGIYGFLMKPIISGEASSKSKHYHALADYACSRNGTHVFFFLKRNIYYGGVIEINNKDGGFFINGKTSPLGNKANAPLFWDESVRYEKTDCEGVFLVNESEKSQPFILKFNEQNDLKGRYIPSDDLYFRLGEYPFPLPSNSIQNMSFCTLSPVEAKILLDLLSKSKEILNFQVDESQVELKKANTIFSTTYLDNNYINEAKLEFSLLSDTVFLETILKTTLFEEEKATNYVLCRQVPISPFKPMNMDRADICLYSKINPIRDGSIPNIVIELKNCRANYHAYNQVIRYLKWLKKICSDIEFNKIKAIIIAPDFYINTKKIDTAEFNSKINMYSLLEKKSSRLEM